MGYPGQLGNSELGYSACQVATELRVIQDGISPLPLVGAVQDFF